MFGRDRAEQEVGLPEAPGLSSDPGQLVEGGWFIIAIISVINASPPAATQAAGRHPGSGLFGRMCV